MKTIQVDTCRDVLVHCLSDSSFDKYRLRTRVAQKRLTLFWREITKKISLTHGQQEYYVCMYMYMYIHTIIPPVFVHGVLVLYM